MAHIVLLGDSIFDSAPNVPAGTEAQAQLASLVEGRHRVSPIAPSAQGGADGRVGRRFLLIARDFSLAIFLVT